MLVRHVYKTINPLKCIMLLIRLLMLPSLVCATSGCCGDIPESLIWSLSFFLVVGFGIVATTYTSYPPIPPCECPPQTVYVKILPEDLQKISNAFRKSETA